jgi:hypothetical protein
MVGAANTDGKPADYSSFSATLVDVATFGTEISTLGMHHQEYGAGSGTSMSSPVVLNIAAKCALVAQGLSPSDLKRILYLATIQDAAWAGNVAAGGMVSEHVALRIAALTGLVRSGKSLDAAADTLALSGDERSQLMALQQML